VRLRLGCGITQVGYNSDTQLHVPIHFVAVISVNCFSAASHGGDLDAVAVEGLLLRLLSVFGVDICCCECSASCGGVEQVDAAR
jgi:hypothetical protein